MTAFPQLSILLIDKDPVTLLIGRKLIEISFPKATVFTCNSRSELSMYLQSFMMHGYFPDVLIAGFSNAISHDGEYLGFLSMLCKCTSITALGVFTDEDIKVLSFHNIHEYAQKPLTIDKIQEIVHAKREKEDNQQPIHDGSTSSAHN